LFAGLVLLTARPFRVGERVRLQAGAVGGSTEGVVSSLGLLYTTLARGEDRIMIPNNVVIAAAVVPLKEPDSINVKVRLGAGIRPSQVQAILDEQIATATRSSATVLLEEIDGGEVVVRVQATPERATDGARLADEIIVALGTVTEEHKTVSSEAVKSEGPRNGEGDTRQREGDTRQREGDARQREGDRGPRDGDEPSPHPGEIGARTMPSAQRLPR
jgi:hypothetical protein